MSLKLTETSKQNRKVTLVTLHASRILDTFLYIYIYAVLFFFVGCYQVTDSAFFRAASAKNRRQVREGRHRPTPLGSSSAGVRTDDDFLKTTT